jgi:hypothetical protein
MNYEWMLAEFVRDAISKPARSIGWPGLATTATPVYRLPEDPAKGFSRFPTTTEARTERERKILTTMNWPRFFHIPMKDELRPYSKSRTGYDPQVDMARF